MAVFASHMRVMVVCRKTCWSSLQPVARAHLLGVKAIRRSVHLYPQHLCLGAMSSTSSEMGGITLRVTAMRLAVAEEETAASLGTITRLGAMPLSEAGGRAPSIWLVLVGRSYCLHSQWPKTPWAESWAGGGDVVLCSSMELHHWRQTRL